MFIALCYIIPKYAFWNLLPVLRNNLILIRIRILDPYCKKFIRIQVVNISFKIFFFNIREEFSNYFSSFSLSFDKPFSIKYIFFKSLYSDSGFKSKKVFFFLSVFDQFLIDIFPPWIRICRKPKYFGSNGSGL